MTQPLRQCSLTGLHEFVFDELLARDLRPGTRVLELGAGSGVFADRLARWGASVVAADLNDGSYARFESDAPFVELDLDDTRFSQHFHGRFDAVVAIEVIEHLENPTAFLRNIAELLSGSGLAYVTSPNIDNFASRLRFLRTGQLRGASETDDPGHITPIHTWTMVHRILPRTELELLDIERFPRDGFVPGPGWKRRLLVSFGPWLARADLAGDINLFVIRRRATR